MTITKERPEAERTFGPGGFRADIQGLRAVAVIAVVLDHLVGWPVGGFVGVDVFFVISGFLITGLMLREFQQTGAISWSGFYRRRARRILPASTVVLIVTVAASSFVFFQMRFDSILDDGIWSFFFMSNWHFAAVDTDYLQSTGPVSPLLHFWSLAVEEQFYVVWPALLIVVLVFAGSRLQVRGRSAATALGVVVGGLAMVSFTWSIWETVETPTWAYFSTFSRAWELAVGALIAIGSARLSGVPMRVRTAMSWVGLLGIVASIFLIGPDSAFPGPWAVVPVVAAALVIGAGVGGTPRFVGVLSNRASQYVGKISYSLYLFHLPVIILLAAVMRADGISYYVAAIALMSALSMLSFHFVEDRIRRSGWLLRAAAPAGHRRPTRRRVGSWRKAGLIALAGWTVATLAVSAYVLQSRRIEVAAPSAGDSAAIVSSVSRPRLDEAALAEQISSALSATQWPILDPSLDNALSGRATEMNANQHCINPTSFTEPTFCTSRGTDPTKVAVVVGDSIAVHWLAAIRAALTPEGYSVHGVALQSCPFADVQIVIPANPAASAACNDGRAKIWDSIGRLKPGLVIASDSAISVNALASGTTGDAARAEWESGTATAIAAVHIAGARLVILAPNPPGLSPADCATRISGPQDCVSPVSDEYKMKASAESAAAAAAGVEYVDTRSWFCDADGRCPAFIGNNLVRYDSVHLTSQFAAELAPLLAAKLAPPR